MKYFSYIVQSLNAINNANMSTELNLHSKKYLECLLAGKRKEAAEICRNYFNEQNTIRELYDIVITPALYEVGQLWEHNMISVAAEHLATAITEGILNEFYPQIIPQEYNGKKVVLTCVTNEEHQVGIKMVADIFELHGWESFFLGIGAPVNELKSFIRDINPQCIAISLSVYFNHKILTEMINELSNTFPDIPVIVGGQAFTHKGAALESISGMAKYIATLSDLESYILSQNPA
jgi:methanogenic corrinoid protein MtbC1